MARADVLVLFGATGDLAKKKLFPALYEMQESGELELPVVAVASSKWTQAEFKLRVEAAIRDRKAAFGEPVNEEILKELLDEMQLVVGDYENPETFSKLKLALTGFDLPVVYLAIAPSYFERVTQGLNSVGLTASGRVVVEKPFGRDSDSAVELDEGLKKL